MARRKESTYDTRVEVRLEKAKKELWETLLRDKDDSLSAWLRRAGEEYEQKIVRSRLPLAEPPSVMTASVPKKKSARRKR